MALRCNTTCRVSWAPSAPLTELLHLEKINHSGKSGKFSSERGLSFQNLTGVIFPSFHSQKSDRERGFHLFSSIFPLKNRKREIERWIRRAAEERGWWETAHQWLPYLLISCRDRAIYTVTAPDSEWRKQVWSETREESVALYKRPIM